MCLRRHVLAALICCGFLLAQTPDRTAQLAKARELADRGTARGLEQALAEYTRIVEDARAAADRAIEGEALYLSGVVELRRGRFPEAVAFYQQSISLYRALANRQALAVALNDLGLAFSRRGDQTAALAALTEAIGMQTGGPDPRERATTLNNLGLVYNELGDPARSRAYFEEVLAIRRTLGDRGPEGAVLSNIGALYYLEGEMQKALDCYLEAIKLRKAGGDRRGAASTLSKVGLVYSALNRPEQALRSFEDALQSIRESGDKLEEADALSHIGGVYRQLGQFTKALNFYEQALKLQLDSGKQTAYANDLSNVAMVYRDQGQYDKALERLQEAYRVDQSIHEQRDTGITIERIGAIQRLRGNPAEAIDYLDKALVIARQLGEKQLEAATLYERGMAHAAQNDWNTALDDAEQAIRVTENVRGGVASYEMRASYLAPLRGQYELAIDALMQIQKQHPDGGYAARAIAMAERSRARSLLDLLTESRSGIGAGNERGVDSALQEKAHGLEASLGVLGARLLRLPPGAPQRVVLEAKLQTESADLDAVRAEIRARSPSYAAITQPEPVALSEIQSLLDHNTIFLEFSLGEPRSYLWLVTPASIESFELASRKTIQTAARKLHDNWSGNTPSAGRELADLLLKQASPKLGRARLVIAAEGALEYIPFSALPMGNGAMLIDTHEVVNVPSASALAILRRDAVTRTRAPKAIAVFADPVFSAQDLRVRAAAQAAVPQPSEYKRSADESGLGSFDRLPGTRREAQQIVALAGAGRSLQAFDFNASQAAALSPQLADYRIIHFATHGILNSMHPELSGLLLSMVDPAGKPIDGFLQTHDIYSMKLRADLVVLSACQTALGTEIAGEGLVGLTRGFMYAGTPRVVASLWRVPDGPTAELMRIFYANMLGKGLPAAAALREAALSLRREPRWSSPYYWAAFILQGEWH